MLEKVITAGSNDYRHFIFAGATQVAVYSRTSAGTNTLRYLREDHQGSVAAILNTDGTAYAKESFTAFGNRRSSCTWTGSPTNGNVTAVNAVTRHGYTWHTALGAMGLNDMNGRIQDAVTGRFLSADPFISRPADTQGYNRYSYVRNNPLTYLDPTGYEDMAEVVVSSRVGSSGGGGYGCGGGGNLERGGDRAHGGGNGEHVGGSSDRACVDLRPACARAQPWVALAPDSDVTALVAPVRTWAAPRSLKEPPPARVCNFRPPYLCNLGPPPTCRSWEWRLRIAGIVRGVIERHVARLEAERPDGDLRAVHASENC
jgi:RHS repeat-associated protein